MLRIILCSCLIILGLFATVSANNSFGPTFGCLTTADAIGFGNGYFGGFVGYGEDVRIVFGSISYGFSDYTEGRFFLGLSDPDIPGENPAIAFGGDVKIEVMDYKDTRYNYPFDLSIGGLGEYSKYGDVSTMSLGAYAVGSLPYKLNGGRLLIPYGRLCFRGEKLKSFRGDMNSFSNYRFGLNIGAKYEIMKDINVYGELQLDGNRGILFGFDMRVL